MGQRSQLLPVALLSAVAACGGQTSTDDPPLGAVRLPACSFADPHDPDPMKVDLSADGELAIVDASGASRPAHVLRLLERSAKAYEAYPYGYGHHYGHFTLARGGYAAASVGTNPGYYQSSAASEWEAALLDRAGRVLWSGAGSGRRKAVFLGAGGHLVFQGEEGMTVVTPAGDERTFANESALARPSRSGVVAVQSASLSGWLDIHTGETIPFKDTEAAGSALPIRDGTAIVYVAKTTLVVDSRAGVTEWTLPVTRDLRVHAANDRFALVGRSDWAEVGSWVRVDLASGEASVISAPSGVRSFTGWCYDLGAEARGPVPVLGDDGSVTTAGRNDRAGGAYVMDPGSTGWTPFGGTYSNVDALGVVGGAGTYVLRAETVNYYCESEPWSGAARPADFTTPSVRVVRPSAGVARAIPIESYDVELSWDGLCARWTQGDVASVMNVVTGAIETTDVVGAR